MRLHLALVSLFCLSAISGAAMAQGAPSDPPLAIHGFNDLTVKNDYITPRGLLGQQQAVHDADPQRPRLEHLPRPHPPIDDISLVAGIWNDIDAGQNSQTVGPWNEFDWFVGANFEINKIWTLGVTYVAVSQPGHNGLSGHRAQHRIQPPARRQQPPGADLAAPLRKAVLQVRRPLTGRLRDRAAPSMSSWAWCRRSTCTPIAFRRS